MVVLIEPQTLGPIIIRNKIGFRKQDDANYSPFLHLSKVLVNF